MFSSTALRALWKRIVTLAAAMFPGFGLGLLAVAALLALHAWLGTRGLVRATAVATQNAAAQGADGVVHYTTRLRFRLPNGRNMLVADSVPSTDADDPTFATGEVVPLLYPPGMPAAARVATVGRVYHWAIVLGVVGAAFLDLGLIARRRVRRR